jgi:dTDP-4-dehydrorhamnose 3,5-epimerase
MGKIMKGIKLTPLKHIIVPGGDIYHALRATDEGYVGFGEAYFSQIKQGVIKGWKCHNRYVLNLVVPVGSIKFVIYDDRQDSETVGEFLEITLSTIDNYQRLTVDPGLWVAFCGMSPGVSMLMDIIPEPHDPGEADKKELYEINYDFKL